jgi:hypothetical protein
MAHGPRHGLRLPDAPNCFVGTANRGVEQGTQRVSAHRGVMASIQVGVLTVNLSLVHGGSAVDVLKRPSEISCRHQGGPSGVVRLQDQFLTFLVMRKAEELVE